MAPGNARVLADRAIGPCEWTVRRDWCLPLSLGSAKAGHVDGRVLLVPVVAVLAGAGWLAGCAGRALLERIPRGIAWPGACCPASVTVLWGGAGALYGARWLPGRWLPAVLALALLATLLTATDLRAARLPDALTLPAYPVLAAGALIAEPAAWPRILAAAGLLGTTHLLMRRCNTSSLGGGDVKLAGALGLIVGAHGWAAVFVFAPLAALLTVGLAVRIRRRRVPHGPGLLVSALLLSVA